MRNGNRLKIGDIEIIAVSDGRLPMQARMLFPETPEEVWDAYRTRFPDAFDADGFMVNLGCYLIRSSGRLVLVDTGLGPYTLWPTLWPPDPDASAGPAELIDDIVANGVVPDEIDTVFLTHLHRDHVGWNLSKDGDRWRPTFANARYLLQRSDWEEFNRPERLTEGQREVAERNYLPLLELGVIDLIDGDQEVAPGLNALHAPGHTPGHMALMLSSGTDRALIVGDLVANPAHVSEPDQPFSPDADPRQARETRHRLLNLAEEHGAFVLGSHLPSPGWGTLVRWQGRRYWQAP